MDCGSAKILPREKYPLYGNHKAIRSCTFLSGLDFPATVHVGSTSAREVAIMHLPVQQTHHCIRKLYHYHLLWITKYAISVVL